MSWPDEIDLDEEELSFKKPWASEYGGGWTPEPQRIRFSEREVTELVISVIVLSIAFSFLLADDMWFLVRGDILPLVYSLIIVLTAFVFHELAHKFMAQRYGLWAEYRMWKEGLIFALILPIISMGSFIFAAPGAVNIAGGYISKKEDGIISLTGPITNIILSIIFFVGFIASIILFSDIEGFIPTLCLYGFMINLWLAAFNMIPFPPLDGAAIMRWNPVIWAIIGLPLMLVMILMMFGIF